VIESKAGLKVVAEAGDGITALELIRQYQPRIAVLDIHMPGMSGFELARTILQEGIEVAVVFLTMHKAEDIFSAAMDAGVRGMF
jgi:DNA-binding NarL/FixJ family response regulator